MRIGVVTGEYPPMQGGVGAYTSILARHYADAGHTVYLYTEEGTAEGHPGIHLTNEVKRWSRSTLRAIRRWAVAHALDVVNLQYETAAFGMSPWIHFLPGVVRDVPVVTTFHDLLPPYLFPKAGPLRRWIVRRLARRSDGAIVTNQEDFAALQDLRHPLLKLIPIGSNIPVALPDDFDREARRRTAGAGPDDFLLAHFGFINHSKGVDTLLHDAAELIERDYPVKLVMIGGRTGSSDPGNAAYVEYIDRLIEKLNLGEYIHWTGYISDEAVSAYLKAADAVVMPFRDGASYRRGSLMAAIKHGCAIITTQPAVNVPAFKHDENMLLAREHTLAQDTPPFLHVMPHVLKLMRDPDLCRHIQQGAEALAAQFDWDHIAANTLATFEATIHQKKDTTS